MLDVLLWDISCLEKLAFDKKRFLLKTYNQHQGTKSLCTILCHHGIGKLHTYNGNYDSSTQ